MVGQYERALSSKSTTWTGYLRMNDTATLHLPRLLCTHVGGTNARIFRMQCRVLEKHLGHTFRLV